MLIKEMGSKVNFIDENGVFVGIDTYQQCCEDFDYDVVDSEGVCHWSSPKEGYVFDTNFFEWDDEDFGFERTSKVKFKLTHKEKPNLYLILSNTHNGYYSHGFEAKVGGEVWQEGSL